MTNLELLVTLWPSFPHFSRFANDSRLAGIRLNSAMITNPELEKELALIFSTSISVPLYFDVKGRQLRVTEAKEYPDHLELVINHPIFVQTPTPVLFKAGVDDALLDNIEDGGRRLVFRDGPKYRVRVGESLHIQHPSLQVHGPLFTSEELSKIEKVKNFGFKKYFLSYVESQKDVDQFLELVGKDCLVYLKIENKLGLEYVSQGFKKLPNLVLLAARGDLFIEIDAPYNIMDALKLIIEKDPKACVGSRIFLSVVGAPAAEIRRALNVIEQDNLNGDLVTEIFMSLLHQPIPSCADFLELAWLYDIGYRSMMLCDEICLQEGLLETAVNAFESFKFAYADKSPIKTDESWRDRIIRKVPWAGK